ncbi:MAG TPA: sensor histidine kinase [Nitrososphaeraceae archaeon]|nr:sensor histidine kinase [Nitrososphaeraceae archaeon]
MLRKRTTSNILSKRNVSILIIIGAIALLLSVFSYHYSSFTSNKIIDVALQEIRSNARIEVHDLSQILTNKLQSTGALLQTLADSPAIHNNEYKRADIIINTRQKATSGLTDFYMWLDKNGKINWLSNINQTTYQKYRGTDLSYRPYFTKPKETHTEYYSSLIESNDKVPRLYISYPVLNMTTTGKGEQQVFSGVVVAAIKLQTLGNVLQNQLFPGFNTTIELLDRNGIILYSNTPSFIGPSFIGQNVFGNKMQSVFSSFLSPQAKNSLNNLLGISLEGNTGSADILVQGEMNTIAYEPVILNGKYFLALYISAPHNLASDVGNLVDQQKNFSTFIVIMIGLVAFGIALLVLLWNKRLESTVNTRTAELRSANEQLKVHAKMQKEFINIAAHELRTPIQPVLSLTQIIRSKIKDAEQGELLDVVISNAKRLHQLAEDILDITRIESQSLKLNKERFNLNDLISNVMQDYRNQVEKDRDNISLLYESKNDIIFFVEADRHRVTQVISNLLNNAIKFIKEEGKEGEGGTISITLEKKKEEDNQQEVLISIKDSGVGIHSDIIPRLFSKFATKSEKGTGLGLFISKNIVEAHGGRIWAENNVSDGSAEKGATFTFSLPNPN